MSFDRTIIWHAAQSIAHSESAPDPAVRIPPAAERPIIDDRGMDTSSFLLVPIDHRAAAALRERGGPVCVADEFPGYPCRQCLEDAQIGEELILVSHDPFSGDSAYRSSSPIFLHRFECSPPSQLENQLPLQLTRRQLSVRSFDQDEMMIDAAVIDGTVLAETLATSFRDPRSSDIHVHSATRGCWAVNVTRSAARSTEGPRS